MKSEGTEQVKLFFVYMPEDKPIQKELNKYLQPLIHRGMIVLWGEREIQSGLDWRSITPSQIKTADLIILLVTPSLITSDYCSSSEMNDLLKRHQAGEIFVLPVIIRSVDITATSLTNIQVFHANGKALLESHNRDQAFMEVFTKIREIVHLLQSRE